MSIITRLGMPRCQKGICGLKPAQAHFSLLNAFASCLVFMLYDGLNHIFTLTSLTPPMQVRLTQGDSCTLLTNSERTFALSADPLNWHSVLSKTKATFLFHLCKVSFFATTVVIHTCIIPWASWAHHPCPSSTEPFSILKVYCSVTVSGVKWVQLQQSTSEIICFYSFLCRACWRYCRYPEARWLKGHLMDNEGPWLMSEGRTPRWELLWWQRAGGCYKILRRLYQRVAQECWQPAWGIVSEIWAKIQAEWNKTY